MAYRFTAAAHRIAAECDRLLQLAMHPERVAWREALTEAIGASRHLLALAADRAAVTSPDALAARALDPQRAIVDATNRLLLQFLPRTIEEELFLRDVRRLRDATVAISVATPSASADWHLVEDVPLDGGARVLVVEDQDDVRSVLQRMLEALGHEVIEAGDGIAGYDAAVRERPDLVLTDITMPGMNGIALLRALKRTPETQDIPVLVVSSQDDLASVVECIEAGAEDHLAKPYKVRLLEARVRSSLERKRFRDSEVEHLRRVAQLTAAARAVEDATYVPGSLGPVADRADPLGRLARVFDRMVGGLSAREQRLRLRLTRLSDDVRQIRPSTQPAISSPESPYNTGDRLGDRYEIIELLGRGGMGTVYRARDRELGEDIAIKVVRGDLVSQDPLLVERLKTEIKLSRRISHPNVVRAHDLGEANGTYFITMEYVKGSSISDILDQRGRLSLESTLAIGTQLCEALSVAHEFGIIHRDIKPANLFVDIAGRLKVMDFGLARAEEGDVAVTMSGFIVGTPQYMAPERLMGGRAGPPSDLFSVGVVLYECLTGRLPFDGDSPVTLAAQMIDGIVTPLGSLVPDVPGRLASVVHQLLSLRPEDRASSARDLAARLAEADVTGAS